MILPRFIRMLTALAGVATASLAGAADYFVAPAGSDAADGSLGAPFQTIQKALSVAMPGDSVKLTGDSTPATTFFKPPQILVPEHSTIGVEAVYPRSDQGVV